MVGGRRLCVPSPVVGGPACRDQLLQAVDSVLALVVFFPTLCLYWRGSWDLISALVLPGKEPFCYWIHFIVGATTLFSYYLAPILQRYISPERKVLYVVFTRLFMMYHGILYMFLWRGVWGLADYYITRHWAWSLVVLVPTLGLMTLFRVLRQTMWPPFLVTVDRGDLLTVANRFGSKPENAGRYFLDTVFTALVANILAIFAWRTIWCVWDGLIYPDDSWRSDVTSFSAGLVGTLILHALQKIFASVSMRLERGDYFIVRLMWEAFAYVVVFVTMSSLWRGGWNMNVRFLISEPLKGGMVNHICGTVLLLLLNVYSLVGGCGCALDGAEKEGGAFFPVQYISVFCVKQNEDIDEKTRSVTDESYIPCEIQRDRQSALSHRIYDEFAEDGEPPVKRTRGLYRRPYDKSGHITTGETEYTKLTDTIDGTDGHTKNDPHNVTPHGNSEHNKYSEKELHAREPSCKVELDNDEHENHIAPDSHKRTRYMRELGDDNEVEILITGDCFDNPQCSSDDSSAEYSPMLTDRTMGMLSKSDAGFPELQTTDSWSTQPGNQADDASDSVEMGNVIFSDSLLADKSSEPTSKTDVPWVLRDEGNHAKGHAEQRPWTVEGENYPVSL